MGRKEGFPAELGSIGDLKNKGGILFHMELLGFYALLFLNVAPPIDPQFFGLDIKLHIARH